MKYYTAKGDVGTTKLFNCPQGVRLSKGSGIFEVLGGVDELNCFVGWCRAVAERSSFQGAKRAEFLDILFAVQEDLFILQAELGGGATRLSGEKIRQLEKTIAQFADGFPVIHSFIIPGATELGALLDVSRAVARRVERLYVREIEERGATCSRRLRNIKSAERNKEKRQSGHNDATVVAYLNRMSSLLFVLARYANHAHGAMEKNPTYT